MNKNKEIEILRAVGILFVIASHLNVYITWSPKWLLLLYSNTYFWGGVDLFFCISGFVITKSIMRLFTERESSKYWSEVFSFWVRRFYRLVPAALFFIFIKIVISIFIPGTKYFGNFAPNLIDFVLQVFHMSNFRYYYCVKAMSECGANPIYWSLSLEEQFYIVFPIAIFLLRERVSYLLILIILIQFPLEREMFSMGWVVRSDAISWGCLIALLSTSDLYRIMKPKLMNNGLFRSVVIFLMLIALSIFARGVVVPFYIGAMAVPCAVLVWLASYDEGLIFRSVKNNKVMLWIGSRSYSIYLTHSLAYSIIYHVLVTVNGSVDAKDTFRILCIGTVLTIVFSEFSYKVIEKPIRDRGRAISKEISSRSV
ncbi:acyltransferase family protein [Dickeya zeae]|uniref:acyltransferase family protein n=1 Tax=Dickeya zeae TaxID=204042 RepID=UPI00143FFAAA|nr:acyltransferase [Dickeya zeae]QIZ46011.1 acyltransferase [Dickeya zeae]